MLCERVRLLEHLTVFFFFCLLLLRLSSAGSLESRRRTAYKSVISAGGMRCGSWGPVTGVDPHVRTRTSEPTTSSHKSLLLSCVWFKAGRPGKFDTGYVGRARTNQRVHPRGMGAGRSSRTHLGRQQHSGPNQQILSTHLCSSLSSADAHKSQDTVLCHWCWQQSVSEIHQP